MRFLVNCCVVIVGAVTVVTHAEPPETPETPAKLVYVAGSTEKVCQLTGDVDRSTGLATLSETNKRFGVIATDLGSSLEHKGRLYFLFGDTWGRRGSWDAVAWADEGDDPAKLVLDFHQGADGKWVAPRVPGILQGAFEIPSGGISIDDVMYVVFTTDHTDEKVMGRSVLARSHDDGRTFEELYELSNDKFINVSFWLADGWVYVYGSGEYRKSSVCLARVRPGDIGDQSKLRYFGGVDAAGRAKWLAREAEAVALFDHDVVGEFSVAYLAPVNRMVMLYNSRKPRGVTMRSAAAPWGPWSQGTVVFNPWRDQGYGQFMHFPTKDKSKDDGLSDVNREGKWGGEYGPYVMGRFTEGGEGSACRIYYTMSTWNPYQVVVMRSDFELGGGGAIED